jgi:hypothetical protein
MDASCQARDNQQILRAAAERPFCPGSCGFSASKHGGRSCASGSIRLHRLGSRAPVDVRVVLRGRPLRPHPGIGPLGQSPRRNRIHFDVSVPHDEAQRRIRAALAAGGVLVSDAHAPAFWVLADPEGNEACVTTWQGRDG